MFVTFVPSSFFAPCKVGDHAFIGVCTSSTLLSFLVLFAKDFGPLFQLPVISPLLHYGGGYLVVLASLVRWFDSVSYVFNGWSYILGDCSGWLPMHFGEMNHLSYRHTRFMLSSSVEILQISSYFLTEFCSFLCFSDILHDHLFCSYLLKQSFLLSLFGVGFFPCGFLSFSALQRFGCDWVPDQALLPGPKFAFSIVVSLLFCIVCNCIAAHLKGGC